MYQPKRERKKPRGTALTLQIGPAGAVCVEKELPAGKPEIELHFAQMFCTDNQGMRPHFKRFGRFDNLRAQEENDLDFTVETDLGLKWLELAEFAPIKEVGHYKDSTGSWNAAELADLFKKLVKKKNGKLYGGSVILMVYATHDHFWVPPPIIRMMPSMLQGEGLTLEAVYMVSPHGTTTEAWPGDTSDEGPRGLGNVRLGITLG